MGYSNYGFGDIQECWVKNGKIFAKDPLTGIVQETESNLPYDVEPQRNAFISENVLLALNHDDDLIIGRDDGSIGIFRDDLLVGLRSWAPFRRPIWIVCGLMRVDGQIHEVLLNYRDRKTLYLKDSAYAGELKEPYHGNLKFETSIAYTLSALDNRAHIIDEKGDDIDVLCWRIPDCIRSRNCTRYF